MFIYLISGHHLHMLGHVNKTIEFLLNEKQPQHLSLRGILRQLSPRDREERRRIEAHLQRLVPLRRLHAGSSSSLMMGGASLLAQAPEMLGSEQELVVDARDFTFVRFLELYWRMVPRQELDAAFEWAAASAVRRKANSNSRRSGDDSTAAIEPKALANFINDEQRDPRLNEILHPFATTESCRVSREHFLPFFSYELLSSCHLSTRKMLRS